MRIVVIGAGGVGGYFGGRLAEAGNDVTFIARGDHLRALHTSGLKVESFKGDMAINPVQATNDPSEIAPVDCILIGVKAWQVPEAAEAIRPVVSPETMVVPLQNGVEAPAQLVSVLGEKPVLGGLCKIISFVVEPGFIRHLGAEPYIAFGELNNRLSERVETLRKVFAAAGITVEIPENIQVAMWEKFLFISAVSGLGALTRAKIGELRQNPETRRQLEEAMQEIFNVAHGHNIPLSPEIIPNTMSFIDNLPPDGTASMQRDIMEGRPSELNSLTGAVVRLGQKAGVETPLNTFIYNELVSA